MAQAPMMGGDSEMAGTMLCGVETDRTAEDMTTLGNVQLNLKNPDSVLGENLWRTATILIF